MKRAGVLLGFASAALWCAAGCTPAPAASPDAPPIAAVHAHTCGKCHAPPEPRSHTRAQLEDAFRRHKKRAHLTPEQWAAMVDYLAAPDGTASSQRN